MIDLLKKYKVRIIISVATLVSVVAITITIVTLINNEKTVISPDFAPIEKETYAEVLNDEETSKLEQQEGGGAVSLTYSKEVTVNLNDRTAELLFQNPAKSNQNIVLQILIKDTVVAQSGLIEPDYGIKKLALLENVDLQKGEYEGNFNVLYYDAKTGEKAIVNTSIPISVVVK